MPKAPNDPEPRTREHAEPRKSLSNQQGDEGIVGSGSFPPDSTKPVPALVSLFSLSLTFYRCPCLSLSRNTKTRFGRGMNVLACPCHVCFYPPAPSACFPFPESQGCLKGKQKPQTPQKTKKPQTNEEMMVGRGTYPCLNKTCSCLVSLLFLIFL